MSKELTLKVAEVKQETADAITIVFDQPAEKIKYKSGQFLTLINDINGKEERRAYSLCSSQYTDEHLAVTVKRVAKGIVSNYLADNVKAGDELTVLEPMGTFCTEPQTANRHVVLFSGGSGITPSLSILKTVLSQEEGSLVSLLYSNRDEKSIIFKNRLDELKAQYGDRLRIIHHLDSVNTSVKSEKKKGFLGFGSKTIETALPGYLTQENIENYFNQLNVEVGDPIDYFMCGPQPMMDIVEKSLKAIGADMTRLKKEIFVSLETPKKNESAKSNSSSTEASVLVKISGEEHTFTVPSGESILLTALDKGVELPFSCQSGLCTACMGKCTSGTVEMDHMDGLTESQVAEGYVLTCIGKATSSDVVIEFD